MPKIHLLTGAVVDSSAIMSILDGRNSSRAFMEALSNVKPLYMSTPTLLELSMVVLGKKDLVGIKPLDDLLHYFGIDVVEFNLNMVEIARRGCAVFGKRHGPANLNMGDLYSYALATSKKLPLFFEGLDFFQTDISDAMAILGYQFDEWHQPLSAIPHS